MRFVKPLLIGGFTIKKITSVSKLGIVVVHKKVLLLRKNVRNVNANKKQYQRKMNAKFVFTFLLIIVSYNFTGSNKGFENPLCWF
jgi:hypothetical protein